MRFVIFASLSAALLAAPAIALDKATGGSAAQQNFKRADADKDGKLTKVEFRKFVDANAADDIGMASMVKKFGAYDTAFARLDANKDGLVTGKELAASKGK